MTMIVDQICDGIVHLELPDKHFISIPIKCFDISIKEGDVIRLEVDKESTEKRKTDLSDRLNKLFNKED